MGLQAEVDGIVVQTDTVEEMVEFLRDLRPGLTRALPSGEEILRAHDLRPTPETITRPRRRWVSGGQMPELPAAAPPEHKPRRCRYCRKPGHFGDTCPDNPFVTATREARDGVAEPPPAVPPATPEPWHGTSGGYSNHSCRCDDCRGAWANRMKAYRRRQRVARAPSAPPNDPTPQNEPKSPSEAPTQPGSISSPQDERARTREFIKGARQTPPRTERVSLDPNRELPWLKGTAPRPVLELAPPEADGRVRVCPTHEGRLSIARTQPNGRPVYMCSMGHETTQSLLVEPRA